MMADDIQAEILQMEKAEKTMAVTFWSQQIISAYDLIEKIIKQTPPDIISSFQKKEGIDIGSLIYFAPTGFLYENLIISISDKQYLTISKDKEILFQYTKEKLQGEIADSIPIIQTIKKQALHFVENVKEQINEKKKQLVEELENF